MKLTVQLSPQFQLFILASRVIGKPSVIEGHFQMRVYKLSILALFGYLHADNIVNSYLNILFAIYHHLLFH